MQNDIDYSYKKYELKSGLTKDESAAITLYTCQSIYRYLNVALRTKDLAKIQPWFAYLKLFHNAIKKLSPVKKIYCRGENSNWITSHSIGSTVILVNHFFIVNMHPLIDIDRKFCTVVVLANNIDYYFFLRYLEE